jgi:hypothetical protein
LLPRAEPGGTIVTFRAYATTRDGRELGEVPWSKVARLVAEIPSRFRRGHPWRLAMRQGSSLTLRSTRKVIFGSESSACRDSAKDCA